MFVGKLHLGNHVHEKLVTPNYGFHLNLILQLGRQNLILQIKVPNFENVGKCWSPGGAGRFLGWAKALKCVGKSRMPGQKNDGILCHFFTK